MLSIISPAKSLNLDDISADISKSKPIFSNRSQQIINVLKSFDIIGIQKLMNISQNLAELNFNRFKQWNSDFDDKSAKQAIFTFTGDVYKGLEIETFNNTQLQYAQKNLRILSGLYGLLKPLDLIQAYRLEMGTKLSINSYKNLYDFWSDDITKELNQEIESNKHEYLLNLASNEYFNAIDKKSIKATIVNPVFKDFKNGNYKIISFYAKKARGLMAKYQLKNEISTIDEIKAFNENGYYFNQDMSNDTNLVFVRDQQ